MPIPPEFKYQSEDDFIQRFVIPLLNRLGFSVIVNYHGKREFGKDIVFAETDRFMHFRYHGMQVKFVDSISKQASHGLTEDCIEAFTHPFKHPHTGLEEYISTFYAVNGGSISTEAAEHYFQTLKTRYGGNAILIDGKGLLALDRIVSFNRLESIKHVVGGILVELNYNRQIVYVTKPLLEQRLADHDKALPLDKLRSAATSNYLAGPFLEGNDVLQAIGNYYLFTQKYNEIIDFCKIPNSKQDSEKEMLSGILSESTMFYFSGNVIEQKLNSFMANIGPLTGL